MQVILELYQKASMADFAIINYNDLDENTIQELIEFSEGRGGYFREDLKRFSIRKRASRSYLQQIFKLSDIDVEIREPHAIVDVFAHKKVFKAPSEADEVIGFGKYKGQTWGELPIEYLKWMQGSMQGHSADTARKMIVYHKTLARNTQEGES